MDWEWEAGAEAEPNHQMKRLRDMLDVEGVAWQDESDALFARTQQWDGDGMVFSAVCGPYAYGEIELWTSAMRKGKQDPVGLSTAEEAMGLIREVTA